MCGLTTMKKMTSVNRSVLNSNRLALQVSNGQHMYGVDRQHRMAERLEHFDVGLHASSDFTSLV